MIAELLILITIVYGAILFGLAFYADAQARKGGAAWLRSPWLYTLSLSVYCTAWTFYGAVGSAARNGLEFLAIYLGPSIIFFAWWIILRRLVRIGKNENITSIADFISSRFGKSNGLAVLVTVVALLATIPYISLQLQSISQSFSVFNAGIDNKFVAFFAAIALSVFTILFGTRHVRIHERQHGVMTAIAAESIVKLVAISLVGIFAIQSYGSLSDVLNAPSAQAILDAPVFTPRWLVLISVSLMAVVTLPRMFHVMVVENSEESHLFTASWGFPLYLFLINLFVLPIAIIGLETLGADANPDYFLISIPLALDQTWLAYLAFIGGVSAATSMIVVATIAVSTMISNHIVVPMWLDSHRRSDGLDDVGRVILTIRRVSILAIMLLAFFYFDGASSAQSLASIGLIAFVGVAQIFPSLIAALFWRGATKFGAWIGISIGVVIWIYTLLIPSLTGVVFDISDPAFGSVNLDWLNPHALFGSDIPDAVVHAFVWSMVMNITMLFIGSIFSRQSDFERLQANHYTEALNQSRTVSYLSRNQRRKIEDYMVLAQRVFGHQGGETLMRNISQAQGRSGEWPEPNDFFVEHFENAVSGVLGGPAAHMLVSQLAGAASVPVSETIKFADQSVQDLEYARALEAQRQELEKTAQALGEANSTLLALDAQKDAFLNQISHELRTPMASIRSFSEILLEQPNMDLEGREHMLGVIIQENERLTRLLDEILDIGYLQSGQSQLSMSHFQLDDLLGYTIEVTQPVWQEAGLSLDFERVEDDYGIYSDYNRLSQVFINIITNAAKYATNDQAQLKIEINRKGQQWWIEFADNGPGVPVDHRESIFEKFSRGGASDQAGSAGLGLAISREITEKLGGELDLAPSLQGACFRLSLPREFTIRDDMESN